MGCCGPREGTSATLAFASGPISLPRVSYTMVPEAVMSHAARLLGRSVLTAAEPSLHLSERGPPLTRSSTRHKPPTIIICASQNSSAFSTPVTSIVALVWYTALHSAIYLALLLPIATLQNGLGGATVGSLFWALGSKGCNCLCVAEGRTIHASLTFRTERRDGRGVKAAPTSRRTSNLQSLGGWANPACPLVT